jgi:pimeloyl-ACP methyl ester carboxylesterase
MIPVRKKRKKAPMRSKQNRKKLPENATWLRFGTKGIETHFYHANGFPPAVYEPLLSRLAQKLHVSALGYRATWPGAGKPPRNRNWMMYADDLIAFLESQCREPVIGIGHSMGATCTILAAEKRPDLFRAVVLIEPAMVSRPLALFGRLSPKALINHMEPARGTLRKTDTWPDMESYLESCKKSRIYRHFDDKALESLAAGVTWGEDGRLHLIFPSIWEAHNYTQPPNVMKNIARLTVPCVAVRGKPSMFFTEAMWREWKKRCPGTVFRENLHHAHLFPLENPQACWESIASGLREIGCLPED